MARNNLTWIKGDITGDIYYDTFHLDSKDIQYSPVLGEPVPDDQRRGGVGSGQGAARVRLRPASRAGARARAQRQPAGGDRPYPAAHHSPVKAGLRACG